MLNHVVGFGLRYWHNFWTPAKAWADYHQDRHGSALQFFASAATVIGLPILALLVLVVVALLVVDRINASRQRASLRKAILLGLAAELRGVRDITSQDAVMFGPETAEAWTVLPHTAVERALLEAGSLDLTAEQILELHELQLRILMANGLVHARLAVPRPALGIWDEPSIDGAGRYSRRIRDQFKAISGLCGTLLAGLQTVANCRSLVGFASQEADREVPESGRAASEAAHPSA